MRILIELALLIAWIGLLLGAGYVTAPVLFAHLPQMTAGDLAGELFHIVSFVGIAAAIILMVLGGLYEQRPFFRSARFISLLAALGSVLISEFVLTPVIVALKTNGTNWLLSWMGGSFGLWHGISQLIYLLTFCCTLTFAVLWSKQLQYR